ncbi:MAG TPA: Flp family type IVb pilin [Alphaproteobacteria bacterium]|nr:Flp family type IVb pilin [Alphaproteobacteria bacterium]
MIKFINRFVRDEEGATAVEYGLLVAVISIVVVGAAILVGENLSAVFNIVADCLNSPSASACS